MAKYMQLAGKHYDERTHTTTAVVRGSQPIEVESDDPLDKMFPGKFVKAAHVERGRKEAVKAQEEAAKSKEPGLLEGTMLPNAQEIHQEAEFGKSAMSEAGEDPDAAGETTRRGRKKEKEVGEKPVRGGKKGRRGK